MFKNEKKAFIFIHIFSVSGALYFFGQIQISVRYYFFSAWKNFIKDILIVQIWWWIISPFFFLLKSLYCF